MSMRGVLTWFVLIAAFAAFSRWTLTTQQRCSLCGAKIVPVHRVDLLADGRITAGFCCVACANEWPEVPANAIWHVRDEVSGEVIDSTRAIFVENPVCTNCTRNDRTHVFTRIEDALISIDRYGGHLQDYPLPVRTAVPEQTGQGKPGP